jgi:very-short-patch-repair endonuclease
MRTGGAAAGRTAGTNSELLLTIDVPIEILVPIASNPDPDGFVVHRTRRPFEICVVCGIPTTSVSRTLEDLASVLPARTLEEVVDQALHRRLVRIEDLAQTRGVVRRLALERTGAAVESVLETRFLRILRDAGLPLPVPQFEIRRGSVLIARVDFAYPAERMAIELDGYKYHASRQAFDRGHRRQVDIQAAGYLIVPFTSTDLRRPGQIASTVRRFLWERGHPNVVQP